MRDDADAAEHGEGRWSAVGRTLLIVLLAFGATALVMAMRGAPEDRALADTQSPGTAALAPAAPQLKAGEQLYLTSCVSCHGVGGVGGIRGTGVMGDKQPDVAAPSLVSAGEASADFYLRTGRMPLAGPSPQPPDKPPAYNDSEIKSLVAYVGSLCDRTTNACPLIPPVNPNLGNLQDGGALFLANCAPCHNSIAVGGALSLGRHAPSLQQTKSPQVGEAIRIGPGQMPVFGTDVFTPQEVDSIVRYVEYLREPEHPGGAPLGYTGPVAEGFVALLLGLGALVYMIRWITRERPTDDEAASHVDQGGGSQALPRTVEASSE